MVAFSSWGNLRREEHDIREYFRFSGIFDYLNADKKSLPLGNGRSYGDVCTNSNGILIHSQNLQHFLEFDPENMTFSCESGCLLKDIQRFLVPRGFMLPVTPGTQLITVGGAIANDVHCKNHHKFGTFGHNVVEFTLVRSNGEELICSKTQNKELFEATIGGIGLTGLIINAKLKLRKVAGCLIDAENIPYKTLDEFYDIAKSSEGGFEHTVAWIDCITGNGERGIFMRGNNADDQNAYDLNSSIKVPFMMPFSLVNKLSLYGFNQLYYIAQKMKKRKFKAHYEKFFYPLDGILEWNRIYGPKGFFQYQCVVPFKNGFEAIKEIQKEIAKSGQGSFLGVLKTFGNMPPAGLMSFPEPGFTYALDFPNRGVKTEKLFKALDSIVENAGGRLYLAKDARQGRELFEKGYGTERINQFVKYCDPQFSSDLSRRLLGF